MRIISLYFVIVISLLIQKRKYHHFLLKCKSKCVVRYKNVFKHALNESWEKSGQKMHIAHTEQTLKEKKQKRKKNTKHIQLRKPKRMRMHTKNIIIKLT